MYKKHLNKVILITNFESALTNRTDMQSFEERIVIEHSFIAEFFFNTIYTASGNRFQVSVKDPTKQSFFFNMELNATGSWKIINAPKLPDWIMKLEKQLETSIIEHTIA
jgi:polyphosphate kinase 2 (PPK2 family)